MYMAMKVGILSATTIFMGFSSLLEFSCADDNLTIEGKVYCDPCRVLIETRFSKDLPGAVVRLECKSAKGALTFSKEAVTDKMGQYSVAVTGDHGGETCEVQVVKSGNGDCADPSNRRARVWLSKNGAVTDQIRYASSLAFMKKQALPGCDKVLKEMGFFPLNNNAK